MRTTLYVSRDLWMRFKALTASDELKMSVLIEGWIREWVQRKEPGNPQRPLTAWVPGHEDELAVAYGNARRAALELYGGRRECNMRGILTVLRSYTSNPRLRRAWAEEIARELGDRGVRVWR